MLPFWVWETKRKKRKETELHLGLPAASAPRRLLLCLIYEATAHMVQHVAGRAEYGMGMSSYFYGSGRVRLAVRLGWVRLFKNVSHTLASTALSTSQSNLPEYSESSGRGLGRREPRCTLCLGVQDGVCHFLWPESATFKNDCTFLHWWPNFNRHLLATI